MSPGAPLDALFAAHREARCCSVEMLRCGVLRCPGRRCGAYAVDRPKSRNLFRQGSS